MKEKETVLDKLTKVINLAGTAILMNLLFLVSCLPIVTIGQAWCGLVSAIRYNIRGDSWFAGFKTGFKTRFLRGTISWCVMLAVAVYLLLDLNHIVAFGFYQETGFNSACIGPLIGNGVMLALMGMMTMSLAVLNVYIPTKAGEWVSNAARMVFRYPLQLLIAAILFWAPVVVGWLVPYYLYLAALVLIGVYYTLTALGITMLLKEPLIDFLLDARAEGTLLAEEGKRRVSEDDDEEYEEEADAEEDETEAQDDAQP